MYQLGVTARGAGDPATAHRWYQRAAAAGHTDAMYNLGVLAQEAGDLDAAHTWYQRAATMNNLD